MAEEGERVERAPSTSIFDNIAFRDPGASRWLKGAGKWLGRGKIWDDVFTRTVANVLTLLIVAAVAGLIGVIHFSRAAWSFVYLFGCGIGLTLLTLGLVPKLRRPWQLGLVAATALAITIAGFIVIHGHFEVCQVNCGDEF